MRTRSGWGQPAALLLLLVTIVLWCGRAAAAACFAQDAQALLAFKQELRDPNGALGTWMANTDCCTWTVSYSTTSFVTAAIESLRKLYLCGQCAIVSKCSSKDFYERLASQ